MKNKDKSYFAGFFDGEGYVGLSKSKRLEVRICNTFLPVLEELKKNYCGNIYQRKQIPGRKTTYDWILINKKEVLIFLNDILPFCKEKVGRINNLINN